MKLLLLIVFFTSESLAVKLECTLFSTSYDPLNCVFENTVIPTNEPIEYLYMDPGVNTLTISNCSAFTLPANLFANYSSIESLSIDYSGFKQLSPGLRITKN